MLGFMTVYTSRTKDKKVSWELVTFLLPRLKQHSWCHSNVTFPRKCYLHERGNRQRTLSSIYLFD